MRPEVVISKGVMEQESYRGSRRGWIVDIAIIKKKPFDGGMHITKIKTGRFQTVSNAKRGAVSMLLNLGRDPKKVDAYLCTREKCPHEWCGSYIHKKTPISLFP